MADRIHTLAYTLYIQTEKNLMSYNEIPNILVDSVVLPNKPHSNLKIIGAAKKLLLHGFRGVLWRDTLPKN